MFHFYRQCGTWRDKLIRFAQLRLAGNHGGSIGRIFVWLLFGLVALVCHKARNWEHFARLP